MTARSDPQRRPVFYDLKNQRLLADPAIGSTYTPVPGFTPLNGDDTITVINTGTTQIDAARVDGGSTTAAGVLQLSTATNSTSTTLAATPSAVKAAYDLATTAQSDAAAAQADATAAQADATTAIADAAAAAQLDTAQTFTGLQTFSDGVDLGGPYTEGVTAVAALDVDCSAGNYFTKTVAANSTFTFSNAPASGTAYSFTLEIAHTSGTITWPASVKWPGDLAPIPTSGKTHLFMFVTIDGGSRWRGAALIDYTN